MRLERAMTSRNGLLALFAGIALLSTVRAQTPPVEAFDWSIWAKIAVLDERGRFKPLDTQAREALIAIAGKTAIRPGSPWTVSVADIVDGDFAALAKTLVDAGSASDNKSSAAARVWNGLSAELRGKLQAADLNVAAKRNEWAALKRQLKK